MRICDASHHLKKTSLWECGNQAEPDAELTTPVILSKATATIRASLGVNASPPDIWAALGLHLHSRLLQRKAVNITSFGAFGFGQDDELSFVQDPVFLHMTRLCLASRKRGTRVQPALSQSENMTELNLKELAAEHLQNCSKDLVKSVVASVLAWVVSWAKSGQEMRLSFLPVGEWVCDGDSVDFHFSDSFCKEVKLQEMNIKEAEAAETPLDSEGTLGNQVEDLALTGEHPTVSVLTGGKLDSGKEKTAGGRSPSTAKEAATRSGSPVARTRYKLRASTFSSKAKQLPPHDQRRFRDVALNVSSSKSTAIATKCSRKPVAHQATSRDKNQAEASAILNAVQAGDVCSGTVAAAKDTRPGTASTCKSKQRATTASRLNTQQVEIINRLLKRLSTRRGQTFQGLNALAAVLRSSKTGVISSTELSLSLRKLGVKVSSAEVKEVAEAFAHGKRGFIDTDKLLDALRGPQLSGMRLDVVTKAFRQMDPTGTGVVGVDEMVKRYDVGFLPQVREGKQSRLEALTAFLQEWASVSSANTNAITFKAFEEYYHNVSACIGNNADFERLIRTAWRIPEDHQGCDSQNPDESADKHAGLASLSGTPSTPVLPQTDQNDDSDHARDGPTVSKTLPPDEMSPAEAWTYLRALLLFPQQYQVGVQTWPTLDNMCRRLGANRVLGDNNETMNVKAFAHALAAQDKLLRHQKAFNLSCLVASQCAVTLSGGDTIELRSLYHMLMNVAIDSAPMHAPEDYNSVEVRASQAIERIRARLQGGFSIQKKSKSASLVDLNTLGKWLQASSSNGDSMLVKYELKSGLQKVGIDVSCQDLDYLFAYFDVNRHGYINYESLLEVLRSNEIILPKLSKPQASATLSLEQKPTAATAILPKAVVQARARRKKQVAPRAPEPNFRRRNLIHRTVWDQLPRPPTPENAKTGGNLDKLEIERRRRFRAAQLIQTKFRGFRARRLAAQLRRKAAATNNQVASLALERGRLIANRKKANRTPMPSAYGF